MQTPIDNERAMTCCDNCGARRPCSELEPHADFWSRVTVGNEIPAGDCPDCGAFCYIVKPDSGATPQVRAALAALLECCELNLDEMEPETVKLVERARSALCAEPPQKIKVFAFASDTDNGFILELLTSRKALLERQNQAMVDSGEEDLPEIGSEAWRERWEQWCEEVGADNDYYYDDEQELLIPPSGALEGSERHAAIRELAQKTLAREGSLEIDNNAVVSEGDDNGAYIRAWVWLHFDGTQFDKDNQ